jgi:xanthine dehydrogenase accessory factor
MDTAPTLRILVRGVGDVASAVAHRLFRLGHLVALHAGPAPPVAHRRSMAFADAVFDGAARLDGVTARLADPAALAPPSWPQGVVPVLTQVLGDCAGALAWDVLVDARMRKRATPDAQRGHARLVIGLGPGFVAGGNVDVAVETAWGESLGAVVTYGAVADLAGEPRAIAGIGRDRLVYAPVAGIWRTGFDIGAPVSAGQLVGHVADAPVVAPLAGILRGVTRHGVPVAAGSKILEVDPRGEAGRAALHGIGERPARIAEGVVAALRELRPPP